MSEMMGLNMQLVILGTGENYAENSFKWLENEYKGKAVYYCGYNEELAHRIYAGSDLFLMPSLYEPCGIGQLIAMHYGALPLVRETGGLKDTVQPYNKYTGEGTGFSFQGSYAGDLMNTLVMALDVYENNQEDWKALVQHALDLDVSWNKSAEVYEQLYHELTPWD